MSALVATLFQEGGEHAEEVSEAQDLYPQLSELFVAALAFFVLLFFMWKFAIPRLNQILEARQKKIQGDLESAERAKRGAEQMLEDYRTQLSGARDEANRIIEEARNQAEQLRRDLEQRAQEEARGIVERAQEEIRAERDRVFQELKAQVGELSLVLAERTVGDQLDRDRHLRLVDDYVRDLGRLTPSGNGHAGNGHGASGASPEGSGGASGPGEG